MKNLNVTLLIFFSLSIATVFAASSKDRTIRHSTIVSNQHTYTLNIKRANDPGLVLRTLAFLRLSQRTFKLAKGLEKETKIIIIGLRRTIRHQINRIHQGLTRRRELEEMYKDSYISIRDYLELQKPGCEIMKKQLEMLKRQLEREGIPYDKW